jgi:hypothetical protein
MTQTPTSLEVRDYGCISYICLPPGWWAPPERVGIGDPGSDPKFFAPGNPDVGIALLYSHRPVHPMYAEPLNELFGRAPHLVTHTELEKVDALIRGASNKEHFKALKMATELWNGRMVLRLEGRWIANDTDLLWLLTDPTGDREYLQEVMFSAPRDEYPKYYSSVMASFKSIQWR